MKKNLLTGLSLAAMCVALVYATAHMRSARAPMEQDMFQDASDGGKSAAPKNWTPNATASGFALASHVAQLNQDWSAASALLQQAELLSGQNKLQNKLRHMALALGAGDFENAVRNAQDILTTRAKTAQTDESGNQITDGGIPLAQLILSVNALHQGDLETAKRYCDTFADGPITTFVKPILSMWLNAAKGIAPQDSDLALADPSFALHRALVLEYMGRKDAALSAVRATLNTPQSPIAIALASGIALRAGDLKLAHELLPAAAKGKSAEEILKTVRHEIDTLTPGGAQLLDYHLQGPAQGLSLAFMDMAGNLLKRNSPDSAILFAQLGRLLAPNLTALINIQAGTQLTLGQKDKAIALYETIGEKDPGYIAVRLRVAEILADDKKLDAAIDTLAPLLSKAEDSQVAYAIADLYRRAEKNKDAVDAYTNAMEIDRKNGRKEIDYWYGYYFRAMAYDGLDDWGHAESDLRRAAALKDDDAHLLNYLGYSWADRGQNLDEAAKMLNRAVALAPTDPYIIDSVGWVAFKQGDMDKALRCLELAIALKPYDPTLNDHLGDIYEKLGRTREARYQWLRALTYSQEAEDKALVPKLKIKLGKDDITAAKTADKSGE